MTDYATVFGVLFLLVVLVFTLWITWISLAGDPHSPGAQRSAGDAEGSSS